MLISSELIQQAPSHVPNPIPKDQRAGSVQDQVIRAPENCKAIPRAAFFAFLRSDLLQTATPGPKGSPGVSVSFLSQRVGRSERVRNSIYRMWETAIPKPIGSPLSFLVQTQRTASLLLYCREHDASRKCP